MSEALYRYVNGGCTSIGRKKNYGDVVTAKKQQNADYLYQVRGISVIHEKSTYKSPNVTKNICFRLFPTP
jgi:hypothetical protein